MLKWFQQHKTPLLFAVILSLLYWSFAYQLVRSDFVKLITLYAALLPNPPAYKNTGVEFLDTRCFGLFFSAPIFSGYS